MIRNTVREGTMAEGQENGSQSPGGLPEKFFTTITKMTEQNPIPGIYCLVLEGIFSTIPQCPGRHQSGIKTRSRSFNFISFCFI